jgi:hypothetical protein
MAFMAFAGAHHVLALEQAGDAGFAGRQATEHEGTMRNRLVARHAGDSGQRGLERLRNVAGWGSGVYAPWQMS